MRLLRAILVVAPLVLSAAPLVGQTPCAPGGSTGPSRDLYCVELVPAAAAPGARGTAELNWIPGPFTVSVAADGTPRWGLRLRLEGLPPDLLPGPGAAFVAWVAAPSLTPIQRLGVVRNGSTDLGPVTMDRFLVMVSAEDDSSSTERRGRLVLRGETAGNRLRPADNYEFFLGAIGVTPGRVDPSHAGHAAEPDSLGWTGVPMFPGLDMLPAEMALRPPERAWQPADDPGAPLARPREIVPLSPGDTLTLEAGTVRRRIGGREYTMFGFNGQYPGPLLQVGQATEITVVFQNRLPLPSTVHWHGLRLENRFDGVPDLTQPAVPPGGSFVYRLRFPDAGLYWYHPHVREDIQQDLGLYGNILVRPDDPAALGPVHRDEFLVLDDLLVGDAGLVPWGAEQPTHAAMGRFGNVLLVNGETRWGREAGRNEVIRLWITNVSNTRTFNLGFGPGARMKLVGSDLGFYAHPALVENIVIAPAERYIVDVLFAEPGSVALMNRVRAIDHLYGRFFSVIDTLGTVAVHDAASSPVLTGEFDTTEPLPDAPHLLGLVEQHDGREPEKVLELRAEFPDLPFVSRRLMQLDSIYFNPVEWAGTMPGMNWATTARQARWTLRDHATGLENMAIEWRFRVGETVRLRLLGPREILHGMQHPVHLHGQRALVLAVNGIRNQNPVWKDTVLVPAGGAVDLLVEFSNPGRWMLHCHIAEHLQAGMMMIFDVEE